MAMSEVTREELEEVVARVEKLPEDRLNHLRENTVHTVAVEHVLLEYGLSSERVDEVVETVEDVDRELWGDIDE